MAARFPLRVVLDTNVVLEGSIQVSSPEAIAQQRSNFAALLQRSGKTSEANVDELLAQREVIEPEPDLQPETIEKLKKLIANRQTAVS